MASNAVGLWAVDVTEVIYYIHGQMEDKKPNDFCCIICVTGQWDLTKIKLLSFFVYYLLFSHQVFRFLVPRGMDSPKFRQNCACVRSLHPIKPGCSLCGSQATATYTIPRKRFCVDVLALAMSLDHPNFAATELRIRLPRAQ